MSGYLVVRQPMIDKAKTQTEVYEGYIQTMRSLEIISVPCDGQTPKQSQSQQATMPRRATKNYYYKFAIAIEPYQSIFLSHKCVK